MEQSNSMENLHFMMSTGNVRSLARLFEGNAVSRKPNFVLSKSKSKSYSSVIITKEIKETEEDGRLSFRDIHSKFESGTVRKSIQRMSSVNSLECLKLQEIKEVGRKTEEIVTKVKNSNKVGSTFYINHLNEIVEMLLQIGQIETDGNLNVQTEKLAILQVLQKCYSQLRGKLEIFLVDDNNEEEEAQKISIRSSIRKWESMIDQKTSYEAPNYSIHFTTYRNEAKLRETKINGEIVKCTDVDDDNKMVEHVRVQNLKDIWERRGSEDLKENETHLIVGTLTEIVNQFEQSTESFVQPQEQFKHETQQIEIQEQHQETLEESESKEDTTKQIDEVHEEEEPKKTCDNDLKFLEKERKHTDDTYNETQVLDSHVVVEYLVTEDDVQNINVTQSGNEDVEVQKDARSLGVIEIQSEQVENNQETPLVQITDETYTCFPTKDEAGNVLSKSEDPTSTTLEFLDEERKNNERIQSVAIEGNEDVGEVQKDTRTPEVTQVKNDQVENNPLIQIEDDTYTKYKVRSVSDGNVLSKSEDAISPTLKFLNEERKSNDIDPKFGQPTGIIPDPNQNYKRVQSMEQNVADDQFVVIHEKEGDKEITTVLIQETTYKEENYLILDNRSVEEIQQSTKHPEEAVLVNGDKH